MAVNVKPSSKRPQNSSKAPAQHSQPSRKGKKAWRKHVDIGDVESGLEEIRQEERVTGSAVHSKANDELFQIDIKGDDKVRRSLPKFDTKQLSYSKILAQRSEVSAVYSRPSSSSKKRPLVSREDKERLLQVGKRKRSGPLNSVMDPTEPGSGSATFEPSHAVKASGSYDVWMNASGNVKLDEMDALKHHTKSQPIKPPTHPHPRSAIEVPAISHPHAGTSYNPPVDSYQELLQAAHEDALAAETEIQKLAKVKEEIEGARTANNEPQIDYVLSRMLGEGQNDENDSEEEDAVDVSEAPVKKPTVRKTKQQRRKTEQQRAEKRALLERTAQKRFLSSIAASRSMRKSIEKTLTAQQQVRQARKRALADKLRLHGLTGQRLGKHKVPEEKVEVQLGEDLSESLRGMKVEGNLFRDRFLSLQRRALIEPRVPVVPKKHRRRTKDVEKHAWKRFA